MQRLQAALADTAYLDWYVGEVLAARIVELMRATRMPNGLAALGYTPADAAPLAAGAFPQRRLLSNAPRDIAIEQLEELYRGAMAYW